MADSDSDEDLKKAIAMSLKESNAHAKPVKGGPSIIDLLSDTESGEDDTTTTRRQVPVQENSAKQRLSQTSGSPRQPSAKGDSAPNSLLGGFDRKKMEQERLERAADRKKKLESSSLPSQQTKRKASISPPQQRPKKRIGDQLSDFPVSLSGAKLSVYKGQSTGLNKGFGIPSTKAVKPASPVSSLNTFSPTTTSSRIQYPDGVVKKTWVYGCPRLGDDIKIEEVLQKDDLDLAVLSSFMVDPDWILSKLAPKTKVIMVLQAKTDEEKQHMESGSDKNVRFCWPSMDGQINCMHSKLQLLSHTNHLRIVVPSANLVPYDWGETGVMENMCFMIDLPKLPIGQISSTDDLPLFATDLFYFLEAMGLDQGLINSLTKFDFSRTAHLAFVHTIGGAHIGSASKRTGYCGLGSAIKGLGLQTEDALSIDYVTASLGNINESFMKCLSLAAKGDDGTTELGWRTDKTGGKKGVKAVSVLEQKLSDEINTNSRIFFPTKNTVAKSKGGIASGGTICLQSKWYDSATFPKGLLRDSVSARGVLMHDKLIYVRPTLDDGMGKAWAYIGSANLSESAWGKLVIDKTTKKPKLNCRNWETGVVFPVPTTPRSDTPATNSSNRRETSMDIFQGHVPVPMVIPGEEYGSRRPWFFMEDQ